MKKILSLLFLAALTVGLLGSCSKIDERISNLEKRIDGIESNQIASIKSQVDAINTSIADLGTIRQNVQTLMNTTPSKENIEELRRADEALGRRIDELKSYTDGELTKYATTEWVKATFATLEQHQWTCDTIAKIDARIGALDAKLSQSISGLESSLKQWVNEQLDAYYTAAQMDAKLGVMQAEIDALKNSKDSERIDSLATELTKTKVAVDSAKANIRSEYNAAVQSAIETSEGKLTQALKDSIAKVNDKITALDTRVTSLEIRMQAAEGKVDNLEAAIGAYTELQGTITEIIKRLLAEVGDKPQSEQDTTIWKCITALQAQCGTFSTAIQTLQGLVGNKDVATQISEAIASLITTQKLSGLADAVSALKDIVYGNGDVKSLTQQIADINEKLSTTYVTKTQLGEDIAAAKAGLQKQIDSLCNVIGKDGTAQTATGIFKKIAELNAKVAALEAVKITIESTEYTNWSDAVQAVLNKVNALGIGNISGLQSALNDLEARLDKIEAMIQSVTILPAYTDGSVEAVNGTLTIDFVVSPAAAVKGVTKDSIKVLVHEAKVQTKAASYTTIPVASATVDETTGDVTITADISKITPAQGNGLTVAVNVKNGLSDFTSGTVPVYVAGPALPAGALSGVFSVSATKKVYFSKGNLWADSNKALHFEANQSSSASSWDASHVSHFTWSSTVEAAVGNTNSGDYLFCDESHKVSVDGGEAIYYELSKDEWTYLFSNHSYKWASVNGVNGYVIAPDGFSGTLADTYADDAALAANNLVFLPAAGYRNGSNVMVVGVYGYSWSSTAYEGNAYRMCFASSSVYTNYVDRVFGISVRLITDASATPAPTPTTTGTAKRTGDIDVNWVQLWAGGPKFAEYNVGVTDGKAESYGGYYTWGGSQDKVDDHNTGESALSGESDTATKLWGSNWRMPTKAELEALINPTNCNVAWTDNYNGTGIKGSIYTGKGDYASNSVFLPAAGDCYDGDVSGQGGYGGYWSSTPAVGDLVYVLIFDSGSQNVYYNTRNGGYSVRAVLAE